MTTTGGNRLQLRYNYFIGFKSGSGHNQNQPHPFFVRYVKSLDTVRAVAALLVVVWHWLPYDFWLNRLPNGELGVNIFFVLSGFLITQILLYNRRQSNELYSLKTNIFKSFYVRRVLRIFPVYYLLLIIIFLLVKYVFTSEYPFFKKEVPYDITYTTNFFYNKVQQWSNINAHFWSLAVEEQFYLIWPVLMLYLPKKWLLSAIFIFILIGIITKGLGPANDFYTLLPFTCFDAFGLGGILAWVTIYQPTFLKPFYHIVSLLALVSLILFIVQLFYSQWLYIPGRTLHAIMALWLVTFLWVNEAKPSNMFKTLFHQPVLLFLGKISYGLYLYHLPLAWDAHYIKQYLLVHLPTCVQAHTMPSVFFINLLLLIFIAWLSWTFIEQPLLRLKKLFAYRKGSRDA